MLTLLCDPPLIMIKISFPGHRLLSLATSFFALLRRDRTLLAIFEGQLDPGLRIFGNDSSSIISKIDKEYH